MTSQVQKAIQWEEMTTREWRYGFYFGDRWQPHQDVTLDLGLRYEYFPLVNRDNGRGVERLDVNTMEVLLGGVGRRPAQRRADNTQDGLCAARRRGVAPQRAHGRCAPATVSPITRCRLPGRFAAPIR